MKIKDIQSNEILDSRGNPTVEAVVILDNEKKFKASVPSGASTGKYEALELRDKNKKKFSGKGVLKACKNIEKKIAPKLINKNILDQGGIDEILINLAGANKKKLGANATLAVSLACVRAGAEVSGLELYEYLRKIYFIKFKTYKLPTPMFNIFNGGAHADNDLDVQEFMIVPIIEKSFAEKLRMGAEIFHSLKKVLKDKNLKTGLGDEGGYAPEVKNVDQVFELLKSAVKQAGYDFGQDVEIALDVGASEFYNPKSEKYNFEKKDLTSQQMINIFSKWVSKYPIFSIEDGLAEDDWLGWQKMEKELPHEILVGDDLVTTNVERLQKAIENSVANAVIIKPNQIGTLSETIDFINLAQERNYKTIISHRSGETNDNFIADLSVAVNADLIKSGAPSRGERVVKYNRLMEIEKGLE